MLRPRRSRLETERGQILVIVAGGLVALLAILALALEGGTLLLNRRDAQNSADLASVAGARIVALSYTDTSVARQQDDVFAALASSADLNNCGSTASAPCVWDAQFVGAGMANLGAVTNTSAAIPTGSLGVRVGVTRSPSAMIGRVIGFQSWTVSTEATAISAKPSAFPSGIMLPIALCGWGTTGINDCVQATNAPSNQIDFDWGDVVDITDGKDAPGGFGWLSWTGSNSAGALSDSVCNPNNIQFSLDSPYDSPGAYGGYIGTNPATGETWFPADPGKSNKASMRACLDGWIASGATVLIPVYDIITGNGNNAAYHITGVAAFILTSREQPAVDNIQGTFVQYYAYTDVPGGIGSVPPGPGDITTFIGLVK